MRFATGLLVLAAFVACRPTARIDPSAEAPPPEAPADATGRDGDVTLGPAFEGAVVRGTAGGPIESAAWDPACVGGVFERPNHYLTVDEARPVTLDATPNGQGIMDLSLIVRGPDGTFRCVDDGNTLDPVLAAMFEHGRHAIWVGTHVSQPAPYELRIRPGVHSADPIVLGGRFPEPVRDGTPPERTIEGTFGGLRIPAETGLAALTGRAGGTRRAGDLGPDCVGHIAQTPDHVIEVLSPDELMFRVESAADTTLVVEGPNGVVLCTDDDDGLNPVVRRMLTPGRYSVFVGSYDLDADPEYTFSVSR